MSEPQQPEGRAPRSGAYARSEAKNQEVREALEPLAPGERPRAVTIAAIAALLLSAGNLLTYLLADHAVGADQGREVMQTFLICAVLLVAAWGMWQAKYWAVLGFQTILALQVIVLALALLRVTSFWVALLFLVVIALSSVLFWYLIRAMARIQMPQAPTAQSQLAKREEAEKSDV